MEAIPYFLPELLTQSGAFIGAKHCPDVSVFESHIADPTASDLLDIINDKAPDQMYWDSEHLNAPERCLLIDIDKCGPTGTISSPASSASDTFPAAFKHQSEYSNLHTWVTLDTDHSSSASGIVHYGQNNVQPLPLFVQHLQQQHSQKSAEQPAAEQSCSLYCASEDDAFGKHTSSSSQLCLSDSDTEQTEPTLSAGRLYSSGTARKASKQRTRQPGRRGRPPKNPGVFSKGYMAIKRYRQRKKGMVEQMECDIADKQQELEALEVEHRQLQLHQQVLEIAITAQDAVIAELGDLKQFMGIPNSTRIDSSLCVASSSSTDCSMTAAQAAAVLDRALNAEIAFNNGRNSTDSVKDWSAVLQRTEAELQRLKQYTQMQRVQSSSAALDYYKSYVADSAMKLAAEVSVALPDSQQTTAALAAAAAAAIAGVTSAKSFAAFPLTAVQAALLWDPARTGTAAQLPLPHAVMQLPDSLGVVSLNLENGQYDLISEDFWKQVAKQLTLRPEQQQQLQLASQLLAAAHERLNQQRQQLQQQLQLWGAGHAGGRPAAAVVACLSYVGESYRTGVQVAAAVESYLLTARVCVLAYNWCFMNILGAEQVAKLSVACWPYYSVPHMQTVVGHLLSGNQD